MHLELKRAIVNWLIDNKNEWQRTNSCCTKFRQYIYDDKGEYIIGGEEVSAFISFADKLIYGGNE